MQFPGMQDIFYDHIFEHIKEQVKASTLSVQDIVNNRKNSFDKKQRGKKKLKEK